MIFKPEQRLMMLLFLFLISCALSARAEAEKSFTVGEAVRYALDHNPSILSAAEEAHAAQVGVDESRSAYYPSLQAQADYSRIAPVPTFQLPGGPSFPELPQNSYSLRLDLNQSVFEFGRRSDEVELARIGAHAAGYSLQSDKLELAYQTALTFSSILYLEKNIAVLEEQINDLNLHLENTRKRLATGTATDFDVLTVRVQLSSVESERMGVETTREKQLLLLARLMGTPENQKVTVRGDISDEDPELDVPALVSRALKNRPEMLLAVTREKGAETELSLAESQNLPSVGANLAFGYNNGYSPDLNELKANWVIGAQLRVPIFDGMKNRYGRETAEAGLRAAQEQTKNTHDLVVSQVKQTVADLEADKSQITTSRLRVQLAQQAYTKAKERYDIGVITNSELLDSRTSLSQAQLALSEALYRRVVDRYALDKAVGQTPGE
jgi:outer membrane protein